MQISESIIIERPLEEVFSVLTDFSQEPRWRSAIKEVRYLDEPGEGESLAGLKIQYISRFIGKRITSTVRITEYERNQLLAYETISGPIKVRGRDTFEPLNGKTRLTINHQGRLKGLFRIAEPLLSKIAARGICSDLKNFKKFVEAGSHR